jgi:hypothetical protein
VRCPRPPGRRRRIHEQQPWTSIELLLPAAAAPEVWGSRQGKRASTANPSCNLTYRNGVGDYRTLSRDGVKFLSHPE